MVDRNYLLTELRFGWTVMTVWCDLKSPAMECREIWISSRDLKTSLNHFQLKWRITFSKEYNIITPQSIPMPCTTHAPMPCTAQLARQPNPYFNLHPTYTEQNYTILLLQSRKLSIFVVSCPACLASAFPATISLLVVSCPACLASAFLGMREKKQRERKWLNKTNISFFQFLTVQSKGLNLV